METKYNLLTRILKNLKTSVLPSGTAANAGKVATIGETGEWEAATPSGGSGGGVLVVHETVTEEGGEEVHTLDTTYADIVAAGFCVLECSFHGMHMFKPLGGYGSADIGYLVLFGSNEFSTDSENGYPVYIDAGEH